MLLYATIPYSTLRYATLRYSTLLYATLRYSTLLYATLRYATLLYSTLLYDYDGTVVGWEYDWSFQNTLLFSMTIMSTVGYGHISPSTFEGRMFTLPYACHSTLIYATLRYSMLLYATLLYATLRYSTLLYATLRYSTLLYATLLYTTLRYSMIMMGQLSVGNMTGHSRTPCYSQ
jgi:uncharacterized protein YjbI with pentapeptide repeats